MLKEELKSRRRSKEYEWKESKLVLSWLPHLQHTNKSHGSIFASNLVNRSKPNDTGIYAIRFHKMIGFIDGMGSLKLTRGKRE